MFANVIKERTMKQFGVKFFEIEEGKELEVEMDTLPDDYIAGLIKCLKMI